MYKDLIGGEGKVQLTRIRSDGEIVWTFNSKLKEFRDWQLKGNKLIVTGTDK